MIFLNKFPDDLPVSERWLKSYQTCGDVIPSCTVKAEAEAASSSSSEAMRVLAKIRRLNPEEADAEGDKILPGLLATLHRLERKDIDLSARQPDWSS